jgi:phosphoenolpyruvate synthase/pyruvate phosphate dikinase
VGPQPHYVMPLAEVNRSHEPLVGGKSARLGTLADAGHPIAPGFCVTIRAYELFLAEARLESLIRMELDRKRFEDMRWEEFSSSRSAKKLTKTGGVVGAFS